MKITDVRISVPANKPDLDTRLLAYASITFDDSFVVHGLKVIGGVNGLFVAMPSKPNKNAKGKEDRFLDIVHPLGHEFRKVIDDAVIASYNSKQVVAQEGNR